MLPLLALLLACDEGWLEPDVPPSLLGELGGDAVIWTAPVTAAPASLPVGLSGPLPADPYTLRSMDREALLGRVCQGGDPALLDRVMVHLQREAGSGPWHDALLDDCAAPGPAMCAEIDRRLRPLDREPTAAELALWHAAGNCPDPALWEWIPRPGGSNAGTVDFLVGQDNQFRPITGDRVIEVADPATWYDDVHRNGALQALAAFDHPESTRRILARTEIDAGAGVWLYRQQDPRARRVFEETCARWPDSWQCVEGLDPMADLTATISAANTDLSALLDRHPGHRGAIVDALADCVARGIRGQEERGGRCLRALVGAGEDERATELIRNPEGWVDPMWESRRLAWLDLSGALGIGRHLVSEGLLPEGTAPLDAREPPVWVADWFVDAERGVVASQGTNVHALRRLLSRVPELRDVVVAGRTWTPAMITAGAPQDELFAWMDGRRYRAVAHQDAIDQRRIAGLANALAETRELDVRFVVVHPGDLVIFGPEQALRRLVDTGYLDVAAKVPPEEVYTPDWIVEEEG